MPRHPATQVKMDALAAASAPALPGAPPSPESKEGVRLWTVDEIERVILFCRDNGVRTFSANGLDLAFERPQGNKHAGD